VVQGFRQVGDWEALTSTTYGRLLLVKVGIVVLVVGVAWVSRALVRAMAAPEPVPEPEPEPDAGAESDDPDEPVAHIARRYLRRSVGVEVAGVVAVLVVSTLLSSVIPAREVEGVAFEQTVVTDQGFGQITVDPAKAGTTAIHVIVTELDGTAPDIAEMDVELELPERDLGPIEVPMEELAPGHYVNDEATIPFPGTWTITATARIGEFDQMTFEATVPVR
jgi:copper transport protein